MDRRKLMKVIKNRNVAVFVIILAFIMGAAFILFSVYTILWLYRQILINPHVMILVN